MNEMISVIERIRAMEPAKVQVVGYADTVGDAGYNRRLSMQRAGAIAMLLAQVGLSDDMVEIVGNGEDGLPEPTADGISEPLNRCAGIFVVIVAGLVSSRGGPAAAYAALIVGAVTWVLGAYVFAWDHPYLLSLGASAVAYGVLAAAGSRSAGADLGVQYAEGSGDSHQEIETCPETNAFRRS